MHTKWTKETQLQDCDIAEGWEGTPATLRERLTQLGYTGTQIENALSKPGKNWVGPALETAHREIFERHVISQAALTDLLRTQGFSEEDAGTAAAAVRILPIYPDSPQLVAARQAYLSGRTREDAAKSLGLTEDALQLLHEDLDWAGKPLRRYLARVARMHSDGLTPAELMRMPGDGYDEQHVAEAVADLEHDWRAAGRQIADTLRRSGLREEQIAARLKTEKFPDEIIAEILMPKESMKSGTEEAAGHIEQMLEATPFSRTAILDELATMGFSESDVASAASQGALDDVDWAERARTWIEEIAVPSGFSLRELERELLKAGFEPQDAQKAISHAALNETAQARRRAGRLVMRGMQAEDLPLELSKAGFSHEAVQAALPRK